MSEGKHSSSHGLRGNAYLLGYTFSRFLIC